MSGLHCTVHWDALAGRDEEGDHGAPVVVLEGQVYFVKRKKPLRLLLRQWRTNPTGIRDEFYEQLNWESNFFHHGTTARILRTSSIQSYIR